MTAIQDSGQFAHIVFQNAAEGIAITDPQGRILAVNGAFTALTGYPAGDVVGKTPAMLRSGRHGREFYARMWLALRDEGRWQGEIWNRRKSGEIYPEWLSISTVRNEAGEVLHYVGVFTDISHIMAEQEKLRDLAYHDPLTRLPNRMLLRDRFEQAARRSLRDARQLAVLMVEVTPQGKVPNDPFLVAASERLATHLRETDTFARYGENEFLVLIEGINGPRDASVTADQLLKALEKPLAVDGLDVYAAANIGISLYPMDGYSLDDLATAADAAMLQARIRDRRGFRFYSAEMTAFANERATIERQLRRAIADGALELHFQPQFEVSGSSVVGVEALVRWTDPELGVVEPERFVTIAEDNGLIHPLGEWVMRRAFTQFISWQAAGIAPPVLSLNISARQLERIDFVDSVAALVAETGISPQSLEFEFRESVLSDVAYVVPALEALDRMGIRLSIDGFGTGFSPLGNLKTLPISKLNIDRSFVSGIGSNQGNDTIVRTVLGVARTLGLRVIAEGVETEDQAVFLRNEGCDEFQGHLYGQAVCGEDFVRRFARTRT
ncbi:PAS domain S-box-containing protein/diguanylate cyclase (GGDEF) domain-containing protein [Aromatoleum tolulyticum]|uniref:PAS domain S-box-containing protein/diguanylate cyclase (GGDEF) domain-containing protein n=1 Tax=Aromatoleum tolulyticum TaxID=34027 RepID=A0A1N6N9G5_9RHOO|nr:bifunctional diguanylate cyclase/phosphodiesterase [Aromatoleum tolulyticum]SIP88672.1 PAS domain S-box-containing protein/diguanylate cyclase (GGDEF) domain-containing protein [Aromatoleum tolulyticum]